MWRINSKLLEDNLEYLHALGVGTHFLISVFSGLFILKENTEKYWKNSIQNIEKSATWLYWTSLKVKLSLIKRNY